MPDNAEHDTATGPATATVEPPAPPSAPPTTATATAPPPKRRGRVWAWVIGILLVAIFATVFGSLYWAQAHRRATAATAGTGFPPALASALAKAGTKAELPAHPVELASVEATGAHRFDATFTADELTALLNWFTFSTEIGGKKVTVAKSKVELPGGGEASLTGGIVYGDSAYSGSISGPVAYENGALGSTGATAVTIEGLEIGGDSAKQATAALLEYLNAYLKAAPGLTITSARVTTAGPVRVSGTAPDAITVRP